jgi:hypothetical protein
MRNGKAGKRMAFFGFKTVARNLLLLVLTGALCFTTAGATGLFSGRVWNDLNNDGLMDETEPGVTGVTLNLKRSDTGELLTALSDGTGAFIFNNLATDSYTFSVELPQGMLLARYRREGDLRSVLTGEDAVVTRTFVVRAGEPQTDNNVGLVDSAIIQGIAYLDLNYNGNYDEGEPPYAGVTLEVIRNASERSMGKTVTDETGAFYFDTVRSGNYRLRVILPDDGSTFTRVPATLGYNSNLFEAREGRRENAIASIDVENSIVYEYYVGVALGGTISGTVFEDRDYSGAMDKSDRKLSSVTVQLTGSDGAVIAQTQSGVKGTYTFSGVMPGEYTVRFLRKDGYTFTKYRPLEEGGNDATLSAADSYGETEPFAFTMSETLADLSAGLVQSATLGGVFFYDENDNGLMDTLESGFTEGRVRLLSQDGEIDSTQTVNADGSYYFSGVVPTTYTLYYLLPEHAEMASVVSGGNTLENQGLENAVTELAVKAGKSYTQPLVGAVKLGTFEGYAFTDANADGVRGEGEAPLPGVTVSLSPRSGQQSAATATTDANGLFSITGLRPNDYVLSMQLPDGMIFSSNILASELALDAANAYSSLLPFATLLNRAENAIGAVAPATLQASVWLDENLNGIQDAGESMLGDLEYTLYDEIHQAYVMTARAGSDGTAVFYNVRPSTYTVSFALPDDSTPVPGAGTFTQDGRTMEQSAIEIHAGDLFTGITGALQCTTSLGGTVEVDQTDHTLPVENAEVTLYMDGSPQPLQSTVTDAQGVYRFDGLWPGNYVIEVVRPDNLVFVRPGDPAVTAQGSIISRISDDLGTSDPIALEMAKDLLDNRVLLTVPAKVGSQVWLDTNGNGLIDGDEPMIGGVTVNLLQDGAAVYTTTSNEWGFYEFADVYPGEYTLETVAYPELAITQSVSALRIISSCLVSGDGNQALSDPFSVTSGSVNFFYHLGYTLKEGEAMPPAITEGAHQIWTQAE